MKTLSNVTPFVFVFLLFLSLSSTLQAQQANDRLLASTAPVSAAHLADADEVSAEGKRVYELNVSAGQSTAHFEGLADYINTRLEYPVLAKENCLEGTVKVQATISATGEVVETKVVQSLGDTFDQSALNVVEQMPDWTPAMNFGVPVKSKKIVEIRFTLQ